MMKVLSGLFLLFVMTLLVIVLPVNAQRNCHRSYPDICIAPSPPDLDCKDISARNFRVLPPDPHGFDRDRDGIGCEQR